MALRPNEAFDQIQKYLRGLSRKQQFTLAGGTALILASLLGFVSLLGRADMKPLYSGLQPEEAQFIARTLAAENISYEISTDATGLKVPANKVDSVRLELASQGLPQTGRLGLELFDKPNWGGSDFAEKVNYQRALEGELERTIRAIRQVQSARVHLVMPHDSLFSEREREAKGSVVVRLREGRLADSAIRSITYLVASAVDNLRPENVTVIDADGNIPILSGRHTQGMDHDEVEAMESQHDREAGFNPGSSGGTRGDKGQCYGRVRPCEQREHAGNLRSDRFGGVDVADFPGSSVGFGPARNSRNAQQRARLERQRSCHGGGGQHARRRRTEE